MDNDSHISRKEDGNVSEIINEGKYFKYVFRGCLFQGPLTSGPWILSGNTSIFKIVQLYMGQKMFHHTKRWNYKYNLNLTFYRLKN